MMNDRTFFWGLIILVSLFILVILIYMVTPEAYMVEECIEPNTSSTKICNGGGLK
jgi:hypothetical protein